jgi:hypothetical protein
MARFKQLEQAVVEKQQQLEAATAAIAVEQAQLRATTEAARLAQEQNQIKLAEQQNLDGAIQRKVFGVISSALQIPTGKLDADDGNAAVASSAPAASRCIPQGGQWSGAKGVSSSVQPLESAPER